MKIVKSKDFTSIVADSEEFFEFNGVRTQRVDFPKDFKNVDKIFEKLSGKPTNIVEEEESQQEETIVENEDKED